MEKFHYRMRPINIPSISEINLPIYQQVIEEEPEHETENSAEVLNTTINTDNNDSICCVKFDTEKYATNFNHFSEKCMSTNKATKAPINSGLVKKGKYLSSKDILSIQNLPSRPQKNSTLKNSKINNSNSSSNLESQNCDFSCTEISLYISYLFS